MLRVALGLSAAGALLTVPHLIRSNYLLQLINIALIYVTVVVGLNFITGYAGQINFGQAAFYGIGAYTTALLTTKAHLGFWVALPLAGLAAALCSLFLGLPTLRLRAYYLAMATIGFGEIVRLVLIHWEPVTGGSSGVRGIPPIALGGATLTRHAHYYYLLLGFALLMILIAARIRHSGLGRSMIAIRDSEIAAEMMGIDTVRVKVLAFVLASVYAGFAGGLYAGYINYISPDQFSGQQAILFFTMLVIGGTGTIAGAVIGTLVLTFLPESLRFLGSWYVVLYGAGIIVIVVFTPGGIVGMADRWLAHVRAQIERLRVRSGERPADAAPLGRRAR